MCTQTNTKNVVKGLLRMLNKLKKIMKKDREKTLFLIIGMLSSWSDSREVVFSFKSSVRTMLIKKTPHRISNNHGLKENMRGQEKFFISDL